MIMKKSLSLILALLMVLVFSLPSQAAEIESLIDFKMWNRMYDFNENSPGWDELYNSWKEEDAKRKDLDVNKVSLQVDALPNQIFSWEDLNNVRNNLNADYVLMNDLDENSIGYDTYVSNATDSGAGWQPIGEFVIGEWSEWGPDKDLSTYFTGTFDGNGYTIANLFINRPLEYGMGLFSIIQDGTIINLNISDADVTGDKHVGILAGHVVDTLIEDVTTSGNVNGGHNLGGIVGTNFFFSTIRNSSSSANIKAVRTTGKNIRGGGLVGGAYECLIINSHTTGTINGNRADLGGLVGSAYEGARIENCYTTGDATGTKAAVGGIVGSVNQATFIIDTYSTGNITANGHEVGGITGNINNGSVVRNCYTTGNVVNSGDYTGGLVGVAVNGSAIEYCYATGNVTNDEESTGGLVGYIDSDAWIVSSYATGDVSGFDKVGGLVGSVLSVSSVTRSYSTGTVTGTSDVGALIGNTYDSDITIDSYWDTVTSDLDVSAAGTGLPTVSMVMMDSFSNWNFKDVWQIKENVSYPYLLWQGEINIPYAPGIISNNDPEAVDDDVTVEEDSINNTIDVLFNDSDIDGNAIIVITVSDPKNGTADFTADEVTYSPGADFYGTDSFTYSISDGTGRTDVATVNVTINPSEDLPLAYDDDAEIEINSINNFINVLLNDIDVDDDVISVTAVSSPVNGTVDFTASGVTYSPNLDYEGIDSFTYTISDGTGRNAEATVNINVTDEPLFANTPPELFNEKEFIIISANDSFDPLEGISYIDIEDDLNGTVLEIMLYRDDVLVPDIFDTSVAGRYELRYEVSDSEGATNSVDVELWIVSNPEITVEPETASIELGETFQTFTGVTDSYWASAFTDSLENEWYCGSYNVLRAYIVDEEDLGDAYTSTTSGALTINYEAKTITNTWEGGVSTQNEWITVETRTVNVTDESGGVNTPPELFNDKEFIIISANDSFDPLEGVSYVDIEDDLDGTALEIMLFKDDILVPDIFDTSVAGRYELRYEISDSEGETDSVDVELWIVSNPEIIVEPDTVSISLGETFQTFIGITDSYWANGFTDSLENEWYCGSYNVLRAYIVGEEDLGDAYTPTIAGTVTINYEAKTITNTWEGGVSTQNEWITVETRTLNVTNESGGANTPPELFNEKEFIIISENDSFDPLEGISYADIEDDLAGTALEIMLFRDNVLVPDVFDTSVAGTYELRYEVSDSEGATDSVDVELWIVSDPEITVEPETVSMALGETFQTFTGVTDSYWVGAFTDSVENEWYCGSYNVLRAYIVGGEDLGDTYTPTIAGEMTIGYEARTITDTWEGGVSAHNEWFTVGTRTLNVTD